ncbi:VOC family protein [Herpetosiphon gulosus]|uniref:VOC domain-containing protein n=1 Tax=Herpetosiphon gulosus TaxID=1973496 RepID=A0ABP9X077_9CHLR
MNTQVFINLAVQDLSKSIEFFKALGYQQNLQFSDETAASIVISDTIYVMLLTHPKFKEFIPQTAAISDARSATEVLVSLTMESREAVDHMFDKALSLGATSFSEPIEMGAMYSRAIQDFDGHIWEFFHMDMNAAPPQ